jgi:hypothetical protein
MLSENMVESDNMLSFFSSFFETSQTPGKGWIMEAFIHKAVARNTVDIHTLSAVLYCMLRSIKEICGYIDKILLHGIQLS